MFPSIEIFGREIGTYGILVVIGGFFCALVGRLLVKRFGMDLFETDAEMYSFDVKRKAGFGPGGEKNFEGVITDLMMQTYLVIRDFRCRLNRKGAPYGWHVAVYAKPESVWGYGAVTADYRTAPAESRALVYDRMRRRFPDAKEADIRKILK